MDIANADITMLRAALDAGEVTSASLVAFYQQRIAAIDRAGPRLNAIRELQS